MSEPRKQVKWFAGEMEKVLKENDYKGGWENESFYYLLSRLKEEIEELFSWFQKDGTPVSFYQNQIIKEAVDVANFAMMIADKIRKEGESG